MEWTRRTLLKALGIGCLASVAEPADATVRPAPVMGVIGNMTGAHALTETLLQEGCECVFGIPGAQENELWDAFKDKHLPYLLVTHEFSAAGMADGYARATGKPGVLCVVPGPGLTNSLSMMGEALLDSVPLVCIVGDVGNGRMGRPFQVHCLDNVALARPVTKQVFAVRTVGEIADTVRQAFQLAASGEPGPVAVVIPYNLFLETARFHSLPLAPTGVPFDESAFGRALDILGNARLRVGIYAGYGCMDASADLVRVAEMLQAPVATSMAGKGAMPEHHPLAVGWGYGPQGTRTAEEAFRHVDAVLAIGVKYSEVSTGFYSQPTHRHLVHVDINPDSLGRIMRNSLCVNADAGLFLQRLLGCAGQLRRPPNGVLLNLIQQQRRLEVQINDANHARCGVDPLHFLRALRRLTCSDALAFVDVTVSQYWATEVFTATQPRTFFNPTNNQAMGWSIPAALGGQKVFPRRQVVTVTGDGCFLMSAMEISTAARENLPVKFFILDDQAYHYMQRLQRPAYLRTTATILANLDYRALAQGWGVAYQDIDSPETIEGGIRQALEHPGPVLCRVAVDYRHRPVRWLTAARNKYVNELSAEQKVRFLARIGSRAGHLQDND